MTDIVFLSNTCIGHQMYVELKLNKEYNTPFIGSLFVNDYDFIKYCSNYEYYMNINPRFGKSISNHLYSKSVQGSTWKYPIMILDDIEIHWIHEKLEEQGKLLEKYNRRNERFKEFFKKPTKKIISILSYSQLMTDHKDIQKVIRDYFNSSNKIELLFIGPEKYNKKYNENNFYIPVREWNKFNMSRNHQNCTYNIGGQNFIRNNALSWLKTQPYFEDII
jgi:uncharacterized protein (DUF1919 family)